MDTVFSESNQFRKVGEMGMIIIDMKMPQRCAECPCFSDSIYGHCNVKDIWLGADDGAWFSDHRPNWCPLQEQEAVEPYMDFDGHDVWRCGKCGATIFHIYHNASDEDAKNYAKFCRHCGRSVKWE